MKGTIIAFKVSDIDMNTYDYAELVLTIKSLPSTGLGLLLLAEIQAFDSWVENEVTWNNVPDTNSYQPPQEMKRDGPDHVKGKVPGELITRAQDFGGILNLYVAGGHPDIPAPSTSKEAVFYSAEAPGDNGPKLVPKKTRPPKPTIQSIALTDVQSKTSATTTIRWAGGHYLYTVKARNMNTGQVEQVKQVDARDAPWFITSYSANFPAIKPEIEYEYTVTYSKGGVTSKPAKITHTVEKATYQVSMTATGPPEADSPYARFGLFLDEGSTGNALFKLPDKSWFIFETGDHFAHMGWYDEGGSELTASMLVNMKGTKYKDAKTVNVPASSGCAQSTEITLQGNLSADTGLGHNYIGRPENLNQAEFLIGGSTTGSPNGPCGDLTFNWGFTVTFIGSRQAAIDKQAFYSNILTQNENITITKIG